MLPIGNNCFASQSSSHNSRDDQAGDKDGRSSFCAGRIGLLASYIRGMWVAPLLRSEYGWTDVDGRHARGHHLRRLCEQFWYSLNRASHEIGIRVALGASRLDVLRLLYAGLRLAAAGLVLGLFLALGLTRFMAGLLYGISATDQVTIICVMALLALAAMLACRLPALKAVRVEPVDAIRTL